MAIKKAKLLVNEVLPVENNPSSNDLVLEELKKVREENAELKDMLATLIKQGSQESN